MPRIERIADIAWEGNLARGAGLITAGSSGAFAALPFTNASRIGQPEGKTSPEELLAAAHGGCFTSSLAGELTRLGHPPERLETSCQIVMDEVEGAGHQIVGSSITVRASVPGIDAATFDEGVRLADEGCPFSTLLKRAGAEVGITAQLAGQMAALYLREKDVKGLLTPADALEAVEASLQRLARGVVDNRPRTRLPLEDGQYAVMACVDSELGYAGLKSYAWTETGTPFVVLLFSLSEPTRLEAVIEADKLGQLRTGAASGVAARYLAREGAAVLGVIGCGWQAASQITCIRAAVPTIERVLVHCRDAGRLADFCEANDCEPAELHRDAADADIVVTVTTSKDPVLRGEWLRDGALVCAVGANDPTHRELDNGVLERAAFVCCDSRVQSLEESGDLIEPVESGVLDWLEVHELQDVVSGEITGRASSNDIVLFKSNGMAAWDLAVGARVIALARERGVGTAL